MQMKRIIKFILHKHIIFLKLIHRITCHNITCFFISYMLIFYFMKNMISSIVDYIHRKHDNLKINKGCNICLPYPP